MAHPLWQVGLRWRVGKNHLLTNRGPVSVGRETESARMWATLLATASVHGSVTESSSTSATESTPAVLVLASLGRWVVVVTLARVGFSAIFVSFSLHPSSMALVTSATVSLEKASATVSSESELVTSAAVSSETALVSSAAEAAVPLALLGGVGYVGEGRN